MKLTGIATFGFGVIIPMSLATRDNDNEVISCDGASIEQSSSATLTTTTPREFSLDQQSAEHELDFKALQNRLQHPSSVSFTDGFNSPTRIPSTINVSGLEKMVAPQGQNQTLQHHTNPTNHTPSDQQQLREPQQRFFTEQLFAQVVQKAELGRVMMDLESI